MEKVKISLMVTEATLAQLERLGRVLVHGVELNRGDVVSYLAAEKAAALEKGKGTLLETVPDDALAGWEKGEE